MNWATFIEVIKKAHGSYQKRNIYKYKLLGNTIKYQYVYEDNVENIETIRRYIGEIRGS